MYSKWAVRAAHRYAVTVSLTAIGFTILGLITGASGLFWVLLLVLVGTGALIFSRRMNQHMVTSERGVHVTHMWGSYDISWGEIENIIISCAPVVKHTSTGRMFPPPERWGDMMARDTRLLLLDPSTGPERIMGIMIVPRSRPGQHLFVEPIDRDTWSALNDGWMWNVDNFGRPLRMDDGFGHL